MILYSHIAHAAVLPVRDIRLLVPLCFVVAINGDAVGYACGHKIGRRRYERPNSRLFRKAYLLQTEAFFVKRGGKAPILARFMPVVRAFTPIVAGMGAMRYARFTLSDVIGAFLWARGRSVAGFCLGSAIPDVDRYLLPLIVLIIVVSIAPSAFHRWKANRNEIALRIRQRIERTA